MCVCVCATASPHHMNEACGLSLQGQRASLPLGTSVLGPRSGCERLGQERDHGPREGRRHLTPRQAGKTQADGYGDARVRRPWRDHGEGARCRRRGNALLGGGVDGRTWWGVVTGDGGWCVVVRGGDGCCCLGGGSGWVTIMGGGAFVWCTCSLSCCGDTRSMTSVCTARSSCTRPSLEITDDRTRGG